MHLPCPFIVGNIMDISCMPGSRTRDKCNQWNMAYLLKFRKSMLSTIRSSIPPLSGYWLISCTSHTITDHDFYWTSLKGKEGKGRSLSATYTGWYTSYVSSLDGKGNFQEEVSNMYISIITSELCFFTLLIFYRTGAKVTTCLISRNVEKQS